MGYSCSAIASIALEELGKMLAVEGEASNVFKDAKGNKYFFEQSRVEHADGSITGQVMKFVGQNSVVPAGSFKVNGDGVVVRFPHVSKDLRGEARCKALIKYRRIFGHEFGV